MNKRVLFIYQNAFSQTGGIQTFNKYFIKALENINKKNNLNIEIASIYDEENDIKTNLKKFVFNKSKFKALMFILKNIFSYDIFIFAHVNFAPLALIVKTFNPKAKIIFCSHGIEIWKKLPKYTEYIMQKSIILTVSNYSKEQLLKYNLKLVEKNIIIFPNCIEIKEENNNINPYENDTFNLLSVTRLSNTEKLKGVDLVIKSLPTLITKIPNIKYNIIGKGDDIYRLKNIAKELGVEKYVNFLGYVEKLEPYYKHCDIFILPSKKEGFGIVYLEAMRYKKPCIACDVGGQTDVVIDNYNGFLCFYGDIKCLEDKIYLLYQDKNLRIKLGENGYSHLMNNFTFEKFEKRLEKVLMS